MPRPSNPTDYDQFMLTFRRDGRSTSSRRNAHAPRSQTPHPAQPAPGPAGGQLNYPVQQQQQPVGTTSAEGWGESRYAGGSTQDTRYVNPVDPAYGGASTIVPSTTSQWIVQFNYNQRDERVIPIRMYEIPQFQCLCGTNIRIVHLPTLVSWQPPFGVLWNFKTSGRSGWYEGNAANTCVSATQCPMCSSMITLHGPHNSGAL